MIDGKSLLDQFLGGGAGAAGGAGGLGGLGNLAKDKLQQAGPLGSFGAGAAAGGLLGLLLGGKKLHKMAGGVVGYGGAAVVGALALRAFQAWQQGQTATGTPAVPTAPTAAPAGETRFLPPLPATPGAPSFELSMVRAMIGAAKADGHIDADEQRKIFDQVERFDLDAASKALVFDALAKPVDLADVAAAAQTPEQRAELYVACRMVIDLEEPAERSYLEALAFRLALPAALVAHLEQQVATALPTA
jgi:uncharacterized membrane protein YebE (DUF533 family)